MPLFTNENMPDFLKRPESAPRPEPKPAPKEDKSIFKGKPSIQKWDLEKELKHHEELKHELKAKFNLSDEQVKEKIKELQERIIPENSGSTIYHSTVNRALENLIWDEKHEAEKHSHDYAAIKKRKEEDEILKKAFKDQ